MGDVPNPDCMMGEEDREILGDRGVGIVARTLSLRASLSWISGRVRWVISSGSPPKLLNRFRDIVESLARLLAGSPRRWNGWREAGMKLVHALVVLCWNPDTYVERCVAVFGLRQNNEHEYKVASQKYSIPDYPSKDVIIHPHGPTWSSYSISISFICC